MQVIVLGPRKSVLGRGFCRKLGIVSDLGS